MDEKTKKTPIVLIIDDNPTSLSLIENFLHEEGLEILVARDGERGFAKAEFASPDLILLDVIMPGIDGFETCRRLKASEITRNIPVIFLTALTESEDKVKGFQEGAVDFITKPIDRAEIVARVMTHLRLKELNENLEQKVKERTWELEKTNRRLQKEIADRKQAVEALKESEERFELAMQFANDGLFDWNLKTNEIYYSPGWKRIVGYENHEIENRFSEWERLTNPEGVEVSMRMIDEILSGKRQRFENEFKMLHKDGHWVDILSRANIVFDKNGQGVRVVGTHVDITERKKTEEQIKSSLQEKEVLIQEIHHRVKNNMQVIISLMRLQADQFTDVYIKTAFQESQSRIYAMAAVHDALHQSENLADIDLSQYIIQLCETTFETYRIDEGNIDLVSEIHPIDVRIEQAYPIGLVLNELLSNALKYAFPRGTPGEIEVFGELIEPDTVRLIVSDNGVGMPKGFNLRTTESFGLLIVRTLVEDQLEGSIVLKPANGTKWEITFAV